LASQQTQSRETLNHIGRDSISVATLVVNSSSFSVRGFLKIVEEKTQLTKSKLKKVGRN